MTKNLFHRTSFLSLLAALCLTCTLGCTKPKQTTAVGAAAGGALGAGLGAIIGNQTGNAGSGVAIGAVAGAATGALVANALQAQQESTRSQDEAIERQERLLQAQRSEISELRNMNSDVVEKKRIALQKRGPLPSYSSSLSYRSAHLRSDDSLTGASSTEVRASLNPRLVAAKSAHRATMTTTTTRTPLSPPEQQKSARRIDGNVKGKAVTQVNTAEIAPSQPEQSTPARLQPVPAKTSASCEEASSEQRAAAEASDTSDKLFHLRKALRLCPDSAALHHELGSVYRLMNRSADATYEFKEALKVDPSFTPARSALEDIESQPQERF